MVSATSKSRTAAIKLSLSMQEIKGGACRASGVKDALGRSLIFTVKDSVRTPVTKDRLLQLVCRYQDGTGCSSECSEKLALSPLCSCLQPAVLLGRTSSERG